MVSALDIRKGLGRYCAGMGLLHLSLMAFACLTLTRRLHPSQSAMNVWLRFYLIYFVVLLLGGIGYLAVKSRRTDESLIPPGVDFAVGVILFLILDRPLDFILTRSRLGPWFSLVPGLFLICYGLVLSRGRQMWRRLDFL